MGYPGPRTLRAKRETLPYPPEPRNGPLGRIFRAANDSPVSHGQTHDPGRTGAIQSRRGFQERASGRHDVVDDEDRSPSDVSRCDAAKRARHIFAAPPRIQSGLGPVIPNTLKCLHDRNTPSHGRILREQQRLIEATARPPRGMERSRNQERLAPQRAVPIGRFGNEGGEPRNGAARSPVFEVAHDAVEGRLVRWSR